jgi:hypothetical protein
MSGAATPRSRSLPATLWELLDRYALRVGAVLIAAAALGGMAYRLPRLVGDGHHALKQSSMAIGAADIDPVKYWSQLGVVEWANREIPPGSTYTIAVGPNVPPATAVVIRGWLIPLRYTPYLRDAQYVIAYDRDPSTIPVKYSKVIDLTWPGKLLVVRR